jgi:hypothetical protein
VEYKGRYWKKYIYTKEVEGPKEFSVEADSLVEALEEGRALINRIESRLSASLIDQAELLVNGQWYLIK